MGITMGVTLQGLPGLDCGKIDVRVFDSVTAGIRYMREDRAATAAGDSGAINIWIDDEGNYRGWLMRQLATKDLHKGKTLTGLREWLQATMPTIQ